MAKNDFDLKPTSYKKIAGEYVRRLKKNGELKGKNKRETKNLRTSCIHHKLNKKGKIRPTIVNEGNGVCTCKMCLHSFPSQLWGKEEVGKIVDQMIEVVDQMRYVAVAADLGEEYLAFLMRFSLYLSSIKKMYGKMANAVQKKEKINKGKNKGKDGGMSNKRLGSWS